MILYYTEKSPFARKVRMVALHHGLLAEMSLVHLTVGTTIDYIHFRLPSINISRDWLAETPQLAGWYQSFTKDPLMVETVPKGGW